MSLGDDRLNDFGGLWTGGMVSSWPVTGPRVICRGEAGLCVKVCESLIKEHVGMVAWDWSVCVSKEHWLGMFAVCRNQPVLSWAVSPGSRPQMPEHQEYRHKKGSSVQSPQGSPVFCTFL